MRERAARLPDDPDSPDVSFRAVVGLYLGAVAGSLVLVGGVSVGVSTGGLVATFPNVLTVALIAGAVLSKRLVGFPERVGRSKWWKLTLCVPSVGFVAFPVGVAFAPVELLSRLVFVCLLSVVFTAAPALGLILMSQNRYIDALTPGDPEVTLHQNSSIHPAFWYVMGASGILAGGVLLLVGNLLGLVYLTYGLLALVNEVVDPETVEWWPDDVNSNGARGELYGYETGLVSDQSLVKSLIPWTAVDGVTLSDDELVIERRWLNVRCDLSDSDDPEAVCATVERLWRSNKNAEKNRRVKSD